MRESTNMYTDPFSDILEFASPRSIVSGVLAAGGEWAVRFPPPQKIKFFAIARGECWLDAEDGSGPFRVREGDVFLTTQRAIVLSSNPALEAVDGTALYADKPDKSAVLGNGTGFFLLGGQIVLDPMAADLLGDVLPPLIFVPASSPHAPASKWLLNRLVEERAAARPGHALAMEQLCQLLFMEMLRAHFLSAEPPAAGILRAVSDKRLAPALRRIHADPSRSWGLEELAAAAGMSRTTFVNAFREAAGTTPIAYVSRWRMHHAARDLRDRNVSVAELAYAHGYASESGFSNAFKRIVGLSPTAYRNRARERSGRDEAVSPPVPGRSR